MKKYSWANFDAEFLQKVIYSEKTPPEKQPSYKIEDAAMLTPFMDGVCSYPDRYFIEKYRDEIEFVLLKNNPSLLSMAYYYCTGLAKKGNLNSVDLAAMLGEMTRKPLSHGLIGAYEKVLWKVGNNLEEDDFYTRFDKPVRIDLSKAEIPDATLRPFQAEAVEALDNSLLIEDKDAGLLVMPTGSGKTRTAVYFLLTKAIKEGYQIVWLTHRHVLVEQPAAGFYDYSGLVKIDNPKSNTLNMLCVSGEHASIRRAEKKEDILVLSVQSTVRSLDYLKRVLAKKVLIVVDEAHHSVAASYRKIIDMILKMKSKKVKLLGLTATPIRASELGTAWLMNLYGGNIIYNMSMAKLIAQGFLSEPVFESVSTDYEVVSTVDDRKYIEKYGEINPSLVDKIARSGERNKVIVDTYMTNRERYGKTIIFALNIHHCISLCDELTKRGVKCDFVYSNKSGNTEVIKRFKRRDFDVLVNINILTEGIDVPDIQTVFLTRQTTSEVLLMQMIGRGLRGAGADGTEKAYIVDFYDKWDTFEKWLNPEFIMKGVEQPEPGELGTTPKPEGFIPFEVILDIYNSITYDHRGLPAYNTILPSGWFSVLDSEKNEVTILVTEDQVDGYKALIKDKAAIRSNLSITGEDLQKKYFAGFVTPPRLSDLQAYLDDIRSFGSEIHFYPLENRKAIDPVYVAQKIREADMTFTQMEELMNNSYNDNPLAQKIFTDREEFKKRVYRSLSNEDPVQGAKVEELPIEKIDFDLTPYHDLTGLYNEVKSEMFGGVYDGISSVEWTDKYYKSRFGEFYFATGAIKINKLLNSKDVPREVIKFLLYHEMLHRDFRFHDRNFRDRERMYPDYAEWDCFLDGQMLKYNLGGIWG